MTIGFIGLGTMGEATARRLAGAGHPLVVWNRTLARCDRLAGLGATVASDSAEVFVAAPIVFLMLADVAAINAVLRRDTPEFSRRVQGRIIVQMGTIATGESRRLAQDIESAGGTYIEAPVSGSRKPAETGELVAMGAGPPDATAAVSPLLRTMCREVIDCGAVPGALTTKLAVNVVLIALVTGLAEAVHFARACSVDVHGLAKVLLAGPMARDVMRMKLPKLVNGDFSAQAAIRNVHENCRLIIEAARDAGSATPLLQVSEGLYRRSVETGLADQDMVAVLRTIETLV
jgi:3-hydroxyisobutyrate dehydrogenase